MSERTQNRGMAAAVAALVALCVVGLGYFLSDSPEQPGSRTGASPPATVTPSRSQRPPQPARAAGSGEKASEVSAQGADGVLEVEAFSADGPLPGAQLQVYTREPADLRSFPAQWRGLRGGETGADGRRVFPVPPGSYSVTARAEGLAPGYAAVVHPPGGQHTRVQILLEEGTELVGTTVVKGTGDPVSLAEIILTPYGSGPGPWRQGSLDAPEEEGIIATSSETGEFRLSGLTPGRYRVEARAPGYVSAVLASVPVPFGARITLDLVPGGRLEGLVLRADGQPAAGAEVLAASSRYGPTALADEAGLFSLEVPQGTYAVSARSGEEAGALDREVTVAVGQRVQGLRLQLGAGARISGKVLRKDGSPVMGARVEVRPQATAATSGLMGTDESGSFSSPPLAAGVYTVRVFMPAGASFDHGPLRLATGEDASLTLTYKPQGNLECQVLDALDHPLSGLRVRASATAHPATADSPPLAALTDAQGFVRFLELEPGLLHVEVLTSASSPGFYKAVAVGKGSKCVLRVPTKDGSRDVVSVEGRVMKRSGAPPDAVMEVRPSYESRSRSFGRETSQRVFGRETFTDDQGRFRLSLRPGQYILHAHPAKSVRCGDSGQSPLEFEAGQTPEATILLEEAREPELRVQVLEADGTPAARATVNVSISGSDAGRLQTDEQGRLEVCLSSRVESPAPFPLLIVSSFDGARAGVIDKADGQRDFTLQLRPLPSVRGRVINPSGTPVRSVVVNASPLLWEHEFSNSFPGTGTYEFMGDQFELSGLPTGPILLIVTVEGRLRASVHLDLRPGEHKALEIPVYPGVPLKGRLINAATRQPTAAEVRLLSVRRTSALPTSIFTANAPPLGEHFFFRDLPPGDHFLLLPSKPPSPPDIRRLKLLPGQVNDLGDLEVHWP